MKRLIIVGMISWICCEFVFGKVFASTSCGPRVNFLGFSQDWKIAFWEEDISDGCDQIYYINAYDISSDTALTLFSNAKITEIINNDDDSEKQKIEYEVLQEIREKYYGDLKIALKKTLILPVENRWLDEQAGITVARPLADISCKDYDDPESPQACGYSISRNGKQCNEQLIFKKIERYLYGAQNVKYLHYNPKYDMVVVVTEHCNMTYNPCYLKDEKRWQTHNAIYIFKLTDC